VVSLKVEEEHCNTYGTLHGGLSAVIVDTISTMALITDKEASYSKLGVSVDMHMSYLKGAKIGDEILIHGSLIKQGRTLAFLDCELRNAKTNELLVKGSHTKFVGK
jgi:acyl-coenzyme A thioesterase 13